MCRSAHSNQQPPVIGIADGGSPQDSPRFHVARPSAPTPEQTNHWLQDMDGQSDQAPGHQVAENSCRAEQNAQSVSVSPDRCLSSNLPRPRSPTPTKMLAAWEESRTGRETACGYQADEDEEGRGDHTDGLIAKLIGACQMNDINKVFSIYDKLCRMRVQLYEGVYKLIIECCMRTQQLGHAMQFYETLKSSGQVVSSRLVIVLIEACAKYQHGDKVHAIWNDWCPSGKPANKGQGQVLLETISALIRTMHPDLARDILKHGMDRAEASLAEWLVDAEVELEELELLNEATAEEARVNGMLTGDMALQFDDLHLLLTGLKKQILQELPGCSVSSHRKGDHLLMEDVDLDLELAAR